MKKILTIIGARPQIIKAAAISRAIKNKFSNQLEEVLVHTGQHYDENMSTVFFDELGIPEPDHQLTIGSGSHGAQTGEMLTAIESLILSENPDGVVVYGDTNSTIAGSLAAVKLHVPVIHIEAGLRSFNKKMPEEINRIATDHFSTLLFTPTVSGIKNLAAEGFNTDHTDGVAALDSPQVYHCGDIMYDNSIFFSKIADEESSILEKLGVKSDHYILSTVHRPSNTDEKDNLKSILRALNTIALTNQIKVVFPIHPRTKNKIAELLTQAFYNDISENILFVPPVSFLDMIKLEKHAQMVISDSGGVQKEAYFFQKCCVILREETEWVEIVDQKAAITVGADYDKILSAYNELKLSKCTFPKIFGSGKASEFICEKILTTI
ncbi:MAG: UDP-GlcNAc3NAcA epimerase [Saprospiraceae bacterium]|jgi:UDP-GlcNAc3NAcA epimerase